MTFNINPENLRKKLIKIYSNYLSKDSFTSKRAENSAKVLDGAWTGSFLLPKDIETAINNLRGFYIQPKITKTKVKSILDNLIKAK